MLRRVVADRVETDIVVLSDCNAMYDPDAVARLIARLQSDPAIGAVTGNVRLMDPGGGGDEEDVILSRLEKRLMYLESVSGSCAGSTARWSPFAGTLVPNYSDGTILDDFVLAMHVATPATGWSTNTRQRGASGPSETLRGVRASCADHGGHPAALSPRNRVAHLRSGLLARFWGTRSGAGAPPDTRLRRPWSSCCSWDGFPGLAILATLALGLLALMTARWGGSAAARKMSYLFVYQAASLTGVMRGLLNLQSGL